MRLIDRDTIMSWVKKVLNISDKKSYLSKLINNIEKQNAEGINLPFKVVDVREKGFIVKVGGLFGYISFYHMPWKYSDVSSWKAVFPYLTGKIFFCKIYKLKKNPLLIIINGEISQFKKPELFENNKYKGITIKKSHLGVFVDIGYHFKWQCGSIVGFLHKLNFESEDLFNEVKKGDVNELFFWGYNEKGELLFGSKTELKEWVTGEIEELLGEILPVSIMKSSRGYIMYLVKSKYNAILTVNKVLYPGNKGEVKKAIGYLKEGDVIHCEVIMINRLKKTIELRWDTVSEIEGILSRRFYTQKTILTKTKYKSIQNRISDEVAEKLNFVGKTVKVEIIRKEDKFGRLRIKYLVEDKFLGKLIIANDTYRISNKEKKQIEKNLQDGEVLNCEVLSVEKNIFSVKWILKDEELSRFINE